MYTLNFDLEVLVVALNYDPEHFFFFIIKRKDSFQFHEI